MEALELMTPPSEIELAEMLCAATTPDHQLSVAGVNILRRLLFSYDRQKTKPAITADDWDAEVFRIGAIKTLTCAYNQEHNWAEDEDPGATTELIREVEAIHADLLAKLGECPARPEPKPMDHDLPF